jgi:hypothetical protein
MQDFESTELPFQGKLESIVCSRVCSLLNGTLISTTRPQTQLDEFTDTQFNSARQVLYLYCRRHNVIFHKVAQNTYLRVPKLFIGLVGRGSVEPIMSTSVYHTHVINYGSSSSSSKTISWRTRPTPFTASREPPPHTQYIIMGQA